MDYKNYTVRDGESLESISASLRITITEICQINQIQDHSEVQPGMLLQVPNSDFSRVSLEEYEEKNEEEELTSLLREVSIDTDMFSVDSMSAYTVEAIYCTSRGDVPGELHVSGGKIVFHPFARNDECELIVNTVKQKAPAYQFRVCIAIIDLVSCYIYELPSLNALNPDDHSKTFFIQLLITKTGKEHKERNSNMPKASVYFKLSETSSNGAISYFDQKINADELAGLITAKQELVKLVPGPSYKTFVPYFDFNKSYQQYVETGLRETSQNPLEESYQDLNLEIEEHIQESLHDRYSQNVEESDIMPELSEKSSILNDSMIRQIVNNMQSIFQIRN